MKLFEPVQQKRKRRMPVKYIAGILYVLSTVILLSIYINYANTMKKEVEKPKLGPFDKVEMDNGFLMCDKVMYGQQSTIDAEDQSHIFYEVLSAPEGSKWSKGDLVKARHIMEQDYDGKVRVLIHVGNVQFGIKKQNL